MFGVNIFGVNIFGVNIFGGQSLLGVKIFGESTFLWPTNFGGQHQDVRDTINYKSFIIDVMIGFLIFIVVNTWITFFSFALTIQSMTIHFTINYNPLDMPICFRYLI